MSSDSIILNDINIEHLVDEVMEEEVTSAWCHYKSDSYANTKTLKPLHTLNIPPDKHSLPGYVPVQAGVLVRLPTHHSIGDTKDATEHVQVHQRILPADSSGKHCSYNQGESDHLACGVCGERAGKHSYYGGQVCPSCRAFFRRSVQAGYNEKFKCSRGKENCKITLVTRKSCQYCRYQSCIAAGMRPSWILSDEERERRFHAHSRERSHKAGEQKDTRPEPTNNISPEDDNQILQYGDMMRRCCADRHDDLSAHLVTELVQSALHGTSLSFHTATQLHTAVENRTRQCLNLLPEFQCLTHHDQDQIIHHNLQMIHRFRQSIWWGNSKFSWRSIVGMLIGEGKCLELEDIPQDLSIKSSASQLFEYKSLFSSPWCQSVEMEVQHKNLMREISSHVDSYDEVEVILLVLIIAFSSEFLDLKDRCQVEKTLLKFALFLEAHYSTVHSKKVAAEKLSRSLMIPAIARQIVQITRNRINI